MESYAHRERKSPRLRGYDYRQSGAYFVTICTDGRKCHFGQVSEGEMRLGRIGQIAHHCWEEIAAHFSFVTLDVFVVMPNHVHGVLVITEATATSANTALEQHSGPGVHDIERQKGSNGAPAASLGAIVASYKAAVTRAVNRTMTHGPQPLWQARYNDHIIRNEDDWNRIRTYVITNPAQWHEDTFYQSE